jgi:alpha,alpha-trehalose phosphorylase
VIAAEVGHVELAYDYLGEAALIDIDDLERNTHDGLHIASLSGSVIAILAGLGGAREQDGTLRFSPRLPEAITRLAFTVGFRGRRLQVELIPEKVSYSLLEGDPLEIVHHGETLTVEPGESETRPLPRMPPREPPRQPRGRVPARRRAPR